LEIVPETTKIRRELVVDDVHVRLPLCLEACLPDVGRDRVCVQIDLVEERLRDGAGRDVGLRGREHGTGIDGDAEQDCQQCPDPF
jgi:hypothetical protein